MECKWLMPFGSSDEFLARSHEAALPSVVHSKSVAELNCTLPDHLIERELLLPGRTGSESLSYWFV